MSFGRRRRSTCKRKTRAWRRRYKYRTTVLGTTDLHHAILSYLDLKSVMKCRLVNKFWNENASHPSILQSFDFRACYNFCKDEIGDIDISQFRFCKKIKFRVYLPLFVLDFYKCFPYEYCNFGNASKTSVFLATIICI